jgi:hypothetical protein
LSKKVDRSKQRKCGDRDYGLLGLGVADVADENEEGDELELVPPYIMISAPTLASRAAKGRTRCRTFVGVIDQWRQLGEKAEVGRHSRPLAFIRGCPKSSNREYTRINANGEEQFSVSRNPWYP